MKDVESDFWKEIFTHAQHRNMCRAGATRLTYADSAEQIKDFGERHPELNPVINDTGTYVTWEIPVTNTITLRLFIQSQVKGTLLQYNNGEQVKIADAKFINNPFPEIETILSNREQYEKDLKREINEDLENNMLSKVSGEFIKAFLIKMCVGKDTTWSIFPQKDGTFKVDLNFKDGQKSVVVDSLNFAQVLKKLF